MKFTHEKPTVPGWYIHRYHEDEMAVKIVSVKGELWCEVGQVSNMNGEWSERLVPVGEIRKAFDEGFADAHGIWEDSRACRVVEGKEEM